MTTGRVDTSAPIALAAMRELLRQCVAETQADIAFVAVLDLERERPEGEIEVPAVFPPTERVPRSITRPVKRGVHHSIKAGRTEATIARTSANGGRAGSKSLVVAPMYAASGTVWGAVAVVGHSNVIEWEIVNPVQQCARAITTLFEQRDEPYGLSERTSPPPPLSRQRVHSSPREDFLLHELRVPLSAATFALEALVQRHGQNWECDDEHLLRTAQSGVEQAQRIVRSVRQWPALGMDVAKPYLKAVAVGKAMERALTLLPEAKHGVVQQLDPDLPLVYGDEGWIIQVFVNLLENALKYSSGQRHIELTMYQPDHSYVNVSVRSWGKGHPSNRVSRASRDEHEKGAAESTSEGMGLNIARYFVASLGGELRITGDGTEEFVVTVTLPIATAACA